MITVELSMFLCIFIYIKNDNQNKMDGHEHKINYLHPYPSNYKSFND